MMIIVRPKSSKKQKKKNKSSFKMLRGTGPIPKSNYSDFLISLNKKFPKRNEKKAYYY